MEIITTLTQVDDIKEIDDYTIIDLSNTIIVGGTELKARYRATIHAYDNYKSTPIFLQNAANGTAKVLEKLEMAADAINNCGAELDDFMYLITSLCDKIDSKVKARVVMRILDRSKPMLSDFIDTESDK